MLLGAKHKSSSELNPSLLLECRAEQCGSQGTVRLSLDVSSPLSTSYFPGKADALAALVLCSEFTSILYSLHLLLINLLMLHCIFPSLL